MSVAIKIDRDISQELLWLSAAFETNSDGRIAWPMEVDQHTFQLIASLSFTPKIADHEKDGAIWSAMNECAKTKKFDERAFVRHLRDAIVKIRSKPTSAHSVLAQINVPKSKKTPKSLSSYYGLSRIDFPDRLATAIVLFQDGLSATQVDVALIKLWTCIELVTSRADAKEPLEKAIERASSIFTPPELTRVRLDFIANSRHAVVHKGESGEHSLLCAQWASIYAGELLRFAAFNKHNLTKYADILDYLSSPISERRLKQNIRMSRLRLRALAQRSKN
ncbi:hypothetical protein [Bradyrhizobium sp. TM102]|uniref:hypothetical protein n=1 Tax=Bradyrhizobium sp. TM102 TaxID=2599819 RepID=UPI0012605939|nr:hypothetical protein [Bradyrhizobium sp. TM102]BBO09241.1 hypothetical protein TM102_07110 [Bradyrhizobium sp. TM102]